MENNLWNNQKCKKCGEHIFQLYYGGKKERLIDMYYCNKCKAYFNMKLTVEQTEIV